jgi:hypothetical protein
MDKQLLQLLESARVSAPTRIVLHDRINAIQHLPDAYVPKTISSAAFATLQQVIARLLLEDIDPEYGSRSSEPPASSRIAERLEESRATGRGNGWRYASLPNDADALALGLQYLEATATVEHGKSFVELTAEQQELLLARVQRGLIDWPGFDAARWFEELLADATELYISNPEVMMHLGLDPFADEPSGWAEIGFNSRQAWEPESPMPVTSAEHRRR